MLERGFAGRSTRSPGSTFEACMTHDRTQRSFFNQYAKAKRRPETRQPIRRGSMTIGRSNGVASASISVRGLRPCCEWSILEAFAPRIIMAALNKLPRGTRICAHRRCDRTANRTNRWPTGSIKIGTVMSRLNRARATSSSRSLAEYAAARG